MKKTTYLIILILTIILTACGANGSNAAVPNAATQNGPAAGELAASSQVALGTIKLDETDNAVTAEQASELLPLWQTLEVLYTSDTAADQEIDALITQIQETMTDQQTHAINSMNLTRQDMAAIMQSQGLGFGGVQNGNTQGGGNANNGGTGFNRSGGAFPAGGPPPDPGEFPAGGPNFQDQGQRAATQSSGTAQNSGQQVTVNPNRIPTPLVQAVIEYLIKKADS